MLEAINTTLEDQNDIPSSWMIMKCNWQCPPTAVHKKHVKNLNGEQSTRLQ